MGSTLNECFIKIQKLVFLPFQRGTGMRAFIVVSEKCAIFMHHEYRLHLAFDLELKAFAARVFDISSFAENVGHDVC